MRLRWTGPAAKTSTTSLGTSGAIALSQPANCESLINSPHRGRKGKQAGTRELVFVPLPYIAVYRVTEDVVEILHIWHGAQDRR